MAQYVDKSAIVEEIKKRIKYYQAKNKKWGVAGYAGRVAESEEILSYINTLKVKEVDLDNNIREYLTNHFNVYEDGVLQSKKSSQPLSTYDIIKVAEYFFELGIQARKRE